MSFKEILFEGEYVYFQDGKEYSQESFTVEKEDKLQGHYFYKVEVLSRVKTGEFLRIMVEAEFNNAFEPVFYSVKRILGGKESLEMFRIDQKDKTVLYEFKGIDGQHNFEKTVTGKPHIATPCFTLSTAMINSKKLDPVHRTTYSVITSNNIWTYEGDFFERDIYMELQDLKQVPLNIGDKQLKATHCKIIQLDNKGGVQPHSHTIYLSKYFFIPYKAVFAEGIEIEIKKLKNHEATRA